MPLNAMPLRRTAIVIVLVPLAVLSMVSGLILMVAIASDQITVRSPLPLLIAAALVYAATLVFLSWNSITNARDLAAMGSLDPLTRLPNRRSLQ